MNFQDIINVVKYLFNTKTDQELVGTNVTPIVKPPIIHTPFPITTPLDVQWVPSPNFGLRMGTPISAIILHDTEGTLAATLSWFQNPASKVSAHYIIDTNGTIYQAVKDENRAWHAGSAANTLLNGRPDVNTYSIGIELVGDSVTPFTSVQYQTLIRLCSLLKIKYNITNEWIACHKDVIFPVGTRHDPQPFNLQQFLNDLG